MNNRNISSVSQATDRYVVYMPGKQSLPYPFHLPKLADVFDLEIQIRQCPAFKSILDDAPGGIHLLKFGKMDIIAAEKRPDDIVQWVHKHLNDARMQPSRRLRKHFPDGPAPRESEIIDIIAVTDLLLNMHERPEAAEEPAVARIQGQMEGSSKRKTMEPTAGSSKETQALKQEENKGSESEASSQFKKKKLRNEKEEERDLKPNKIPNKVGSGQAGDPINIDGLEKLPAVKPAVVKDQKHRPRNKPCFICKKRNLHCLVTTEGRAMRCIECQRIKKRCITEEPEEPRRG